MKLWWPHRQLINIWYGQPRPLPMRVNRLAKSSHRLYEKLSVALFSSDFRSYCYFLLTLIIRQSRTILKSIPVQCQIWSTLWSCHLYQGFSKRRCYRALSLKRPGWQFCWYEDKQVHSPWGEGSVTLQLLWSTQPGEQQSNNKSWGLQKDASRTSFSRCLL